MNIFIKPGTYVINYIVYLNDRDRIINIIKFKVMVTGEL